MIANRIKLTFTHSILMLQNVSNSELTLHGSVCRSIWNRHWNVCLYGYARHESYTGTALGQVIEIKLHWRNSLYV